MTRRYGAAQVPLPAVTNAPAMPHGTEPGPAPLATFAHASDLHLGPNGGEAAFAPAEARAARLWEDLRGGAPLQWLVVSGDLTHRGSVEPEALVAARGRLEAQGIPWDALPGNHDLCPSADQARRSAGTERYEDVPLAETVHGRAFGPDGLFFRRALGGVEFIGAALRAGDPDGQLGRLRDVLSQPAPVRARVVIGHYPTEPVRTDGPLRAWGPGHLGPTAAALGAMLQERHPGAPPVVAYLFGHVHVLAAGRRGSVWHATPGAVAAGCPGYRRCAVWPDRIDTCFLPLSDPTLATCGFWSARRPEACADPEHGDYATYHGGTAAERVFSIPLPPI